MSISTVSTTALEGVGRNRFSYPKRLIEVDLPIKRISQHARREKSIRHGHISTLHIWWARRPLAACRAVICAALWPDPADPNCPEKFRSLARSLMQSWAQQHLGMASPETYERFVQYRSAPEKLDNDDELRNALLDFIADFANWDNSNAQEYLASARSLTQAAHESLGGATGTSPLVVDSFAGGGSIPLEAMRVGADAFATDLNPIPVLLNKVVLEFIPKFGQQLADEVRKWGEWIKREAEKELDNFYPRDTDGAMPIAYLWARTVRCEGPGCGAEVPLLRSLWLAKRPNRQVALRIVPDRERKRVDFRIIVKRRDRWAEQDNGNIAIENPTFDGTVKRGSATCPCCGYTTPIARVREQLKTKNGGANEARLFSVVVSKPSEQGRFYRLPNEQDLRAIERSATELVNRQNRHAGTLDLIPTEPISLNEIRRISVPIYGMTQWGHLFSKRQSLALVVFTTLIGRMMDTASGEESLKKAVATCLALSLSRLADFNSSISRWANHREGSAGTFGRQALPMLWDFAETCPLSDSTGSFTTSVELVASIIESQNTHILPDHTSVQLASATRHPLPDDYAQLYVTDPPYYDAIPYSHLSDFFYVWLRRSLGAIYPDLFLEGSAPKHEEIVVDRPHTLSTSTHDIRFYEHELARAFLEGKRILRPDGVATIVFASKTTASWEAILKAVVDSGWIITGSWPIDTELETRVAAQGQARLASSVHLVCRPRENPDGSLCLDDVGDWRDVLQELPGRIHQWMSRLSQEGIVGADAIFACLGPALEIFSRYEHVEKASGETVALAEYLEHVWAAVAKEALMMVFAGADASGFEEDARLTAMWLWTLSAGQSGKTDAAEESEDEEEEESVTNTTTGYVLEFDAARKIAQGLGARLESLTSIVEVKGESARLLPVAERTRKLFGKDEKENSEVTRKKKAAQLQLGFLAELEQAEETGAWGAKGVPSAGATALDRVHQSMILFAAGRGEALRRFFVDEGVGRDERFWRLAQVLSYMYPSTSDEKRWIDGVLARKKGLGF